jgi:cysteine synthase
MVGPTTGALIHAALHSDLPKSGRAVLISADNAAKYLSAYAKYIED